MEKTEAIIFDLGGVLLNINYHLTRQAFENRGILNFDAMYSQADANELFQRLETGTIADQDFYRELNIQAGLELSESEIKEAWNAMLLDFRESSLDYLETLRPRYKVFLLSNTNYIHLEEFQKIYQRLGRKVPFDSLFDKAYYSCKIGLRKPNRDIYEYVIKENDLIAEYTLFVDDSIQNVEGAISTGLGGKVLAGGSLIEELGF